MHSDSVRPSAQVALDHDVPNQHAGPTPPMGKGEEPQHDLERGGAAGLYGRRDLPNVSIASVIQWHLLNWSIAQQLSPETRNGRVSSF